MNKHRDHLIIIPEDEADRSLARGFCLHLGVKDRHVQIERSAGGWAKVRDTFLSDFAPALSTTPTRRIVLLLDFDERENRRREIEAMIPPEVKDRVFLLGVWSNPENLKSDLGHASYEDIGSLLAEDCFRGTDTTWSHDLLAHNKNELARLREQVRPFLFDEN